MASDGDDDDDICSEEELRRITDKKGRRFRAGKQKQILAKMQIAYLERPDGSLVVSRSAVYHRLLGAPKRTKPGPEPDFN